MSPINNIEVKVLVVDDEPHILGSIQDLLEDEFQVVTSEGGESALSILQENHVGVILSDQRMPGLSGSQFLEKAAKVSKATRVLITGYSDLEDLVEAVNNGHIYAYVAKPWDPTELKVMVGRAIHHYELARSLERERNQLKALHEIDKAIAHSLDLAIVLNVLLEQVSKMLNASAAAVLLWRENLMELECAHSQGFRTSIIENSRVQLGQSLAGRTMTDRKLLVIPNLSAADVPVEVQDLVEIEGFVSYLALPLLAKGRVSGVLEIFHREPVNWSSAELVFAETLAGQGAIAIEQADLFDKLQRSNTELVMSYDTTIESLAKALDLRDRETEGHSRRVTQATLRLAREMNVPADAWLHIRRGALMHDIGKIGIPDAILQKPGPLTDEEREVINKHPGDGYEMLKSIRFLRPALDIPYCHHEKWDGSGYPRGLKGEEIPLAARIFAIVDVWDALSSKRPYMDPWPTEKIRAHLKEQSGKHFDPKVADVFLKLVDQGEMGGQ